MSILTIIGMVLLIWAAVCLMMCVLFLTAILLVKFIIVPFAKWIGYSL